MRQNLARRRKREIHWAKQTVCPCCPEVQPGPEARNYGTLGQCNRRSKQVRQERTGESHVIHPHSTTYTIPFSTRGIMFVNFRDVAVAWSVLLAECIGLKQNLSFWAAPRNSLKTLQTHLLRVSDAAPGEYLQGPSEERALSSPLLLNDKGRLVHTLVYLGLGMDFTCLFTLCLLLTCPWVFGISIKWIEWDTIC